MISIITGIHNQLGMNRLFCEYLKKNTYYPYQLIVVDNMSADGSGDFFREHGAEVIRNDRNYSYPVVQNQGAAIAKHDFLVFLNNDLIVSRNWDRIALELMSRNGLDIATCAGTNRLMTKTKTRLHMIRWQFVKTLMNPFGTDIANLRRMHELMFGCNFDGFCEKHRNRYTGKIVEGIAGFNIIMTRRGWDIIGQWDETIQAGDFDIFLRVKQRSIEKGDIKPVHLLCEIYLHHFIRLTLKSDFAEFADRENIRHIAAKWPRETIENLMRECDRIYFGSNRSSSDFEWKPGDLDTTLTRMSQKEPTL